MRRVTELVYIICIEIRKYTPCTLYLHYVSYNLLVKIVTNVMYRYYLVPKRTLLNLSIKKHSLLANAAPLPFQARQFSSTIACFQILKDPAKAQRTSKKSQSKTGNVRKASTSSKSGTLDPSKIPQANPLLPSEASADKEDSAPIDPGHQSNHVKNKEDQPSEDEFLTTIFEHMEPYIDTYAVYKRLIEAGFTPTQCDELINLLIAQLNTKLSKLSTKYCQIHELENEQYLFESAQQELGVDITRNRESHINEAINLIHALERDYTVLSDELNNHLIEMKNDIEIAINDQKSENTLLSKRIMLRIQETNHKITTEITMAMRSEIESLRWHLSRWGVITILTCVITAFVSFYLYRSRLQKKLAKAKTEFAPLLIYEPSELDDDDYHADLDPDSL